MYYKRIWIFPLISENAACSHQPEGVYCQAVNHALGGSAIDHDLEAQIEVLKKALEDMDLAGLRGQYPELAGGSDADVRLHKDIQGRLSLLLQGRKS